jgi:hypothetical protein
VGDNVNNMFDPQGPTQEQPEAGDSELQTFLQELKVPQDVAEDTVIWRYMDLPKFVSMLATGGLWFAKASALLDDPFEGFCVVIYPEFPTDEHGPNPTPSGQGPVYVSLRRLEAELRHDAAEECGNARDCLYVNSWRHGAESMAMWQIYGSVEAGVAITSTVGRFRESAKFEIPFSQTMFGKVGYLPDIESSGAIRRDFRDGFVPFGSGLIHTVLTLGFNKRHCYDFEEEWRAALYYKAQPEKKGDYVRFDLDRLITGVYVAPRAQDFFLNVVQAVMDKFSLAKPLEKSPLLRLPPRQGTA